MLPVSVIGKKAAVTNKLNIALWLSREYICIVKASHSLFFLINISSVHKNF